MKVKLKQGEKLSSNYNFCNLNHSDWVALNQGKSVELDTVPELIKKQIEGEKSVSSKKGDK